MTKLTGFISLISAITLWLCCAPAYAQISSFALNDESKWQSLPTPSVTTPEDKTISNKSTPISAPKTPQASAPVAEPAPAQPTPPSESTPTTINTAPEATKISAPITEPAPVQLTTPNENTPTIINTAPSSIAPVKIGSPLEHSITAKANDISHQQAPPTTPEKPIGDVIAEDLELDGGKYTPKNKRIRKPYTYMTQSQNPYIENKVREGSNTHIPKTKNQGEYIQMLFIAAAKGDIGTISTLISRGVDINARTADKRLTPLMYAVTTKNMDGLRYLLSRGANPDLQSQEGKTALHYAAIQDNYAMFNTLISSNASSNLRDLGGMSALDYVNPARKNVYSLAIVQNAKDKGKALLEFILSGDYHTAKYLIDHGAPIDKKDSDGNTPLHLAATSGNLEILSLLLSSGAHTYTQNHMGMTPLNLAISSGNTSAAQLIETVNIRNELSGTYYPDGKQETVEDLKAKKPTHLKSKQSKSRQSSATTKTKESTSAAKPTATTKDLNQSNKLQPTQTIPASAPVQAPQPPATTPSTEPKPAPITTPTLTPPAIESSPKEAPITTPTPTQPTATPTVITPPPLTAPTNNKPVSIIPPKLSLAD